MREIWDSSGGKIPAQVSLNWIMSKGVVPIPGAENARQAEENAAALGWELSADEVVALEHASRNL